jgi:hypothetical protein
LGAINASRSAPQESVFAQRPSKLTPLQPSKPKVRSPAACRYVDRVRARMSRQDIVSCTSRRCTAANVPMETCGRSRKTHRPFHISARDKKDSPMHADAMRPS